MKRKAGCLVFVVMLAVAAWSGWHLWSLHHVDGQQEKSPAEADDEASKKAVALVETVPIKRGRISRSITLYGNVTAQPDKLQTVSQAFECRIARLLVSPGESVVKDAPLVEIEPSAESQLLFDEARRSNEATAKELRQTRQRFDARLATNQELGAAEEAAKAAENKLQNLEKRGIAERKTLVADAGGLIGDVKVQAGQIVPAGTPLLELIPDNQIEVKLGAEPDEVQWLNIGQPVHLLRVNDTGALPVEGKIRLVTHRVNPDVRLVDVFVSLPAGSPLLLNEYVRGNVEISGADNALLVPRAALLPDGDAWSLFVVQEKHAIKKRVQKGIESGGEIEITGTDLHGDEQVVVTGNYELQDGMAVETR